MLGKIKEKILDKGRQIDAFLFLVRFTLLAIPFYIVGWLGISIGWLQDIVAKLTVLFLNAADIPAALSGTLITLPGFAGYIAWDCTGWKSMVAFIALVVATDTTWRKRLYGLLFLPAIFAINLLRVFVTFYVAYTDFSMYSFVHSILWSWGLIAAILIIWVLWLRFVVKPRVSLIYTQE
ncbi:MAG: archaeosortase/exosortase family protein [Candidatus Aenigmatarchaeota archaeon]